MEEVDSIIFHFLRQLNIHIDDEAKHICDLPVEVIIQSAAKCIITINPIIKVPTKLPSGISHRIEVAANIASICKDLGFKSDVGYQTFLYYNEAELRQVFMFLIEHLPTEGKQITNSSTKNSKSLLFHNISKKIDQDLNSIWIPPCCKMSHQETVGDFIQHKVSWAGNLSIDEAEIIKKLSQAKIATETNLKVTETTCDDESITTDKPASPEQSTYVANKSLRDLKEMSIILRQKLDTLESDRNVMEVEYSQVQKSYEKVEADFKNVYNILQSMGITEIEPENLDDNFLDKIHKNMSKLHRKSEELTSRNLSLKVEIDKTKSNMISSESERTRCKKILSNLKDTAKLMKEEYESKQEMRNNLTSNYEKLRGGNKRSVYTKRIMEIISNVDKQNVEIQKILEDTRQLQKEINSLEGQLDRCFSIADETLFRDAKRDDQAKKAYKLLALLHSECNTIVSLVNDTGTIARDIVDLEDNINAEETKRVEETLNKIKIDLVKIKEESADIK